MNGRVRGIFLDTTPLRLDRDYRWLWSGQVVNGIGNQITRIALPYQVYVLTGSTLAIAALTLFQLVPILLFALGAGSLADAVDRRKLLMATQVGLAACSLALVLLALSGEPPVWTPVRRRVLCRGRLLGGRPAGPLVIDPAARPARATALGDRAQPAQLPDGLDRRAGHRRPAHRDGRAGRRLRRGPRVVRGVVRGPARDPRRSRRSAWSSGPGLEAIREGLAFARRRRAILGSFVIDLNAMIFGMPTSLFPVLALDVFQTGRPASG